LDTRRRILILLLSFLVSRAALYAYLASLDTHKQGSDILLYEHFTSQYEAARAQGVPFNEYYKQTASTTRYPDRAQFEYPPWAVVVLNLPRFVAGAMTQVAYFHAFRFEVLLFDVAAMFVMILLVRRIYPQESSEDHQDRWWMYLIGGLVFPWLLYDRLDLLLGVMVLFALTLLVSRVHYLWSFAMLALAVNFKVVPVVLAPVWVLGSLPGDRTRALWNEKRLVHLGLLVAGRSLLLLALIVGLFLPFYLLEGPSVLGFVGYHAHRPIHIESTYGGLLIALNLFGHSTEVVWGYGSFNLDSSFAPLLLHASLPILASLLLAATGILFLTLVSGNYSSGSGAGSRATLAQERPDLMAMYALLMLLLSILSSKVFSPQYLLWLLPLFPLLPLARDARRFLWWAFIAVAVVTSMILNRYWSDLVGHTPETVGRYQGPHAGPTGLGIALVVTRNLLFMALTLWLALKAVRAARRVRGRAFASS
jgi:hypothetical protein